MSSEQPHAIIVNNPWRRLRELTPARIALGRTGISQPTAVHLAFQVAHARARNAVHHALDVGKVSRGIEAMGHEAVRLHSAAADRPTYLQRPDLGRRLDAASREKLGARPRVPVDAVFVVADGLSAFAIEENAVPFLATVMPKVVASGWRLGPVALVEQGRVAVGDEIAGALDAGLVVMLIGERPGLSSPDSLGVYMTYGPRAGVTTDADRNCISNIRREGLSYEEAAHKLLYLMAEARNRRLSGVNLKDEAETLAVDAVPRSRNFLTDGAS